MSGIRLIFALLSVALWIGGSAAAATEEEQTYQGVRFAPAAEFAGTLKVRPKGDGIELWASKATLDDILSSLVRKTKFEIIFYCGDPASAQEPLTMRVTGDSRSALLRSVIPEDYALTYFAESGQSVAPDSPDLHRVQARLGQCDSAAKLARRYRSVDTHPALKKPPREITLDALEGLLANEGLAVRAVALRLLRQHREDPRAAELVLQTLAREQHPLTLIEASRFASRSGGAGAKFAESLRQKIKTAPYFEMVQTLAVLDRDLAWPALQALTRMDDPKATQYAVRGLSVSRDPRGIPWLLDTAKTAPLPVANQATTAIAFAGGSKANDALTELLHHEDPTRQMFAAIAISALQPVESGPVRAELQAKLRAVDVNEGFIFGLAKNYIEPIEYLMSDPIASTEAKVRTLRVLKRVKNNDDLVVLSVGLLDEAPEVRRAAAEVIAGLGHPGAIPPLVQASRDPDPEVRRRAIVGLEKHPHDLRIVQTLARALTDPSELVRKAAVDGFGVMGEPGQEARMLLLAALKNPDRYVSEKAGSILDCWGLR